MPWGKAPSTDATTGNNSEIEPFHGAVNSSLAAGRLRASTPNRRHMMVRWGLSPPHPEPARPPSGAEFSPLFHPIFDNSCWICRPSRCKTPSPNLSQVRPVGMARGTT